MTSIVLTQKEADLTKRAIEKVYNQKIDKVVQDAAINGEKKKSIIRRANEYKEILEKLK